MSRPPIIISNGSILNKITYGLNEKEKKTVKKNLRELYKADKKDDGETEVVYITSIEKNAPYLYWRSKKDGDIYENKIKKYKDDDDYNGVFDDMDGKEDGPVIRHK